MAKMLNADASPEKRLFISLLTRDIPLVAALLDLLDNSINSAVEPYSERLTTAEEYLEFFSDESIEPSVSIALNISTDRIEIIDSAGGISATVAQEHVFKFGRGNEPASDSDRLSVYGIGLKRAIFKLGNSIKMRSDHQEGGFDLKLDVAEWAKTNEQPWTFKISARAPSTAKTGTSIVVSELYDDVKRRVSDGVFVSELKEAIARTYAFYLAKVVSISVNGENIDGVNIDLGKNHASSTVTFGAVTCAMTAGIGIPDAGKFREKSSGWFVLCNGRAVVSADKTALTGWGSALPRFQPKHRPFLGTVFFVAKYPEELPWTTTKSGINEDSFVWQSAKRHMASLGREVISFLDGRYTDEGTEVPSRDLQEAAGGATRVSVLSAAVATPKTFKAPTATDVGSIRIQYDAHVNDIRKIAKYLRKPGMSGSDVGRHTFNYFLRNEVGDE